MYSARLFHLEGILMLFFLSPLTAEISPICPVVTFVMALLAKYVLLVSLSIVTSSLFVNT